MEINLFLGIAVAFLAFYLGVPDVRESSQTYLQMESFYLVLLGTIASTLISTSFKEFRRILRAFRTLFINEKQLEPHEAVEILVHLAEVAQRSSKQDLVKEVEGTGDVFLKRAMLMLGDGLDRDFIEKTMDTDITEQYNRYQHLIRMIRTMGSFAPMFGMTGTVMGIIQVLKNVTDVDNIVSGMSLALLTTLYGLMFSSIIFIPISHKIHGRTEKELLTQEIIKQGTLAILDKEIPLKVDRHLRAYLEKHHKFKDD